MRKACAQIVSRLRLKPVFGVGLSTGFTASPVLVAHKSEFIPLPGHSFMGYLSPSQNGYFTSTRSQFSPLSTPPITTTSTVKMKLFIIKQGA